MESQFRIGEALEVLRTIPDDTFHCCVTSPPYWGLRDYNGDVHQLGLEETPEAYVAALVEIFEEVKRTLRADGTLWLNLGDKYINRKGGRQGENAINKGRSNPIEYRKATSLKGYNRAAVGLCHKQLVGIPWRVALALQAAGWILRSEIIWHKPNAMPETVIDRPARAHEHLFLLSISERYHYDAEAVKIQTSWKTTSRFHPVDLVEMRNLRTVWIVPTRPNQESHYATYPDALIEPCILAGCPPGGIVLDPFLGSGTTARVAERLGRRWFGIEINPEYEAMIRRRTAQIGLFVEAG